jgi:hypothetical protein
MDQTNTPAVITTNDPLRIKIEGVGSIYLVVQNKTVVKAQSQFGILWEGLLYGLDINYALHDDLWYPVSGFIITGTGSTKAPSKVQSSIMMLITTAVNGYLPQHPEIFEAWELEKLRQDLRLAQSQLTEARSRLDKIQRDRDNQMIRYTEGIRDHEQNLQAKEAEFLRLDAELAAKEGRAPVQYTASALPPSSTSDSS